MHNINNFLSNMIIFSNLWEHIKESNFIYMIYHFHFFIGFVVGGDTNNGKGNN